MGPRIQANKKQTPKNDNNTKPNEQNTLSNKHGSVVVFCCCSFFGCCCLNNKNKKQQNNKQQTNKQTTKTTTKNLNQATATKQQPWDPELGKQKKTKQKRNKKRKQAKQEMFVFWGGGTFWVVDLSTCGQNPCEENTAKKHYRIVAGQTANVTTNDQPTTTKTMAKTWRRQGKNL